MKDKCPLCQSKNIKPFLKRKEKDLMICLECNLVFVHPFPSKKEVEKIYTQEEFIKRASNDPTKAGFSIYLKEETLIRKRFKRRVALIKKFKKKGKLLDIGCSTGFFLSEAQKAGYDVYGIDIMDFAVDFCRKRGLKNVFKGTLEKVKLPREKFDIIVAMEILEHLWDPKVFLKKVSQLLNQEGILLVSVPNRKSLGARLMGKFWVGYHNYQHLFIFEPETMKRLFSQYGFKVVKAEYEEVYWGFLDVIVERAGHYYSYKTVKIVRVLTKILGLLGISKIPVPAGGLLLLMTAEKE